MADVEKPASAPDAAATAKNVRIEKLNSDDAEAPAAEPAQLEAAGEKVPTGQLSQLDDPKDQCSVIARLTIGQFSSAACYMAMMFFALSTAINCVVLDKSLDDRAPNTQPRTSTLRLRAA